MIKLSKRLQAVANLVPEGARLADIGSDHAKLPVSLIELKKIQFAVAGEISRGPYSIAKIATEGYNIYVRLADGLEAIKATDKIDTVVIAGMGGFLISKILTNGNDKLAPVRRLILQPNNEEIEVRRWLMNNGFSVVDEHIFEDKNKIYEIIVAEHGQGQLTNMELQFGRKIRQSEIFHKKWQSRLREIDKILDLLPERKTEAYAKLRAERSLIMEVFNEN